MNHRLVETHIFSFVVGRAFVTDIEKLKISCKTRSLDVVKVLKFFSEVTKVCLSYVCVWMLIIFPSYWLLGLIFCIFLRRMESVLVQICYLRLRSLYLGYISLIFSRLSESLFPRFYFQFVWCPYISSLKHSSCSVLLDTVVCNDFLLVLQIDQYAMISWT